jgi:hypothetical protein
MALLMPLHYFFGGGWGVTCNSRLTLVGLGNLPKGSPIFFVHAFVVWYVVVVTEWMVYKAMRKFLTVRFDWLNGLVPPQSTTVLVENIPERHCSDLALKTFFSHMFPGKVETAEIVKHTPALTKLYEAYQEKKDVILRVQYRIAQKELAAGEKTSATIASPIAHLIPPGFLAGISPEADRPSATPATDKSDTTPPGHHFSHFGSTIDVAASEGCFTPRKEHLDKQKLQELADELEELQDEMGEERERIFKNSDLPMIQEEGEAPRLDARARAINSSAGFVTFTGTREALLALNTRISPDTHDFVMSIPPQPTDIIYKDLRKSEMRKTIFGLVGYAFIVLVFCVFAPMVVSISAFVELESLEGRFSYLKRTLTGMPWARPFIRGTLATLVLMIFLSFLPTALMAIFRFFYTLRARAWLQQELQKYYFWFLVLFILLVTTFGTEIVMPALKVGITPMKLAPMLANSLPQASHFYLNYAITQWVSHALDMIRWVQLLKYWYYRGRYSERKAVSYAEPEDQDYFGIGARSARWTLDLVVALVFCSVSPLINALTLIGMFMCRVNHGYLSVFAETRKADLGGPFFVQQLWHTQFGVALYALLMCGIFIMRARSMWPPIIAMSALVYCVFCMLRFRETFAWEHLPFEVVCTPEAMERASQKLKDYEAQDIQDRLVYQPPELCVHLDIGDRTGASTRGCKEDETTIDGGASP